MALPTEQFLIFSLHHQTFAIPLNLVIKVVSSSSVTPNARATGFVFGAIHNLNTTIPIVDLRQYLGLPKVGLGSQRQVLITEFRNHLVGWVVDRVIGVYGLNDLETSPTNLRPGTVLRTVLGNALLLDLAHMCTSEQQMMEQFENKLGVGNSLG